VDQPRQSHRGFRPASRLRNVDPSHGPTPVTDIFFAEVAASGRFLARSEPLSQISAILRERLVAAASAASVRALHSLAFPDANLLVVLFHRLVASGVAHIVGVIDSKKDMVWLSICSLYDEVDKELTP
jgi:hypothetical protein